MDIKKENPFHTTEFANLTFKKTMVNAQTAGCMIGAGTSAAPVDCSTTAGMKFNSIYTKSSATSGDSRNTYLRHYIAGAGGAGEALRAYCTVDGVAVAGTVNGVHASLDVANSGSISGLGNALRATLHVPNGDLAGTTSSIMSEIYADGSSSNNTGTMSHFRVVLDGNGTGVTALKDVYFMEFSGMSAGSGEYIDTDITTGTGYGGLKVKIPGVGDRYIFVVSA